MNADRSYVDHHQPTEGHDARHSNEPRHGLRPELPPGTLLFTPEAVRPAVAEAFQVDEARLLAPGRNRQVSEARDAAWWLLRRHSRAPLEELAKALGRNDHSTPLRGIQRCDERRAVDAWFRETTDRIERVLELKAKGVVAA